jgi:hypothetical protein
MFTFIWIDLTIICYLKTILCFVEWGYAVAQLVEALRYKLEDRGFDFRWSHWNFFINLILPVAL